MEQETLDAIAETMNSRYGQGLYYTDSWENDPKSTYIMKDTTDDTLDIALGYGVTKMVLEEHGVIPIKTLHLPEEEVIRIWFREIETKEVTKEVHTI
jgi:hypothetical protein